MGFLVVGTFWWEKHDRTILKIIMTGIKLDYDAQWFKLRLASLVAIRDSMWQCLVFLLEWFTSVARHCSSWLDNLEQSPKSDHRLDLWDTESCIEKWSCSDGEVIATYFVAHEACAIAIQVVSSMSKSYICSLLKGIKTKLLVCCYPSYLTVYASGMYLDKLPVVCPWNALSLKLCLFCLPITLYQLANGERRASISCTHE